MQKLKEAEFFYEKLKGALRPAAFSIRHPSHLCLNIRVNSGKTTVLPINEEEAQFYLSAFLSAGRSVTFVLQSEWKEEYASRFHHWRDTLSAANQTLFTSMNNQRVMEVHKTGAQTDKKAKKLIVRNKSTPDAIISWPEWHFRGQKEALLESCEKYLDLLQALVETIIQ